MTEGRFYANNDKVLPLPYAQSVVYTHVQHAQFVLPTEITDNYSLYHQALPTPHFN